MNFTIASKNIAKGEIVLKLKFESPGKVSDKQELDVLEVNVQQEIEVNG